MDCCVFLFFGTGPEKKRDQPKTPLSGSLDQWISLNDILNFLSSDKCTCPNRLKLGAFGGTPGSNAVGPPRPWCFSLGFAGDVKFLLMLGTFHLFLTWFHKCWELTDDGVIDECFL